MRMKNDSLRLRLSCSQKQEQTVCALYVEFSGTWRSLRIDEALTRKAVLQSLLVRRQWPEPWLSLRPYIGLTISEGSLLPHLSKLVVAQRQIGRHAARMLDLTVSVVNQVQNRYGPFGYRRLG